MGAGQYREKRIMQAKAPMLFFLRWFDNDLTPRSSSMRVDWARVVPFVLIHLGCFAVLWTGYSSFAIKLAIFLYCIRIFSIGAFYHRYFAHKAFQTNRFWQTFFTITALMAVQRGPLWWAAHHRDHHSHSDQPEDAHSPHQHGFWFSHMGWFLCKKYFHYNPDRIRDFARFPELRWLDRFDVVVPILFGIGLYVLGDFVGSAYPEWGTSGWQVLVWGFCISTVCVFHATFTINSLCHCFGSRPYPTHDFSRNNLLFALYTFGEGWHNNHHHYPISARQGFKWWEIDFTYYLLRLLEYVGVVHSLKHPPKELCLASPRSTTSENHRQRESEQSGV